VLTAKWAVFRFKNFTNKKKKKSAYLREREREREGGVKETKRDRQLIVFEQSNVNFINTSPQIGGGWKVTLTLIQREMSIEERSLPLAGKARVPAQHPVHSAYLHSSYAF
jgi:hypothetical protein